MGLTGFRVPLKGSIGFPLRAPFGGLGFGLSELCFGGGTEGGKEGLGCRVGFRVYNRVLGGGREGGKEGLGYRVGVFRV